MENPHNGGDLVEELTTAASQGNYDNVNQLISMGVNVNATNQFGRTALQVVRLGSCRCVEILLKAGANVNVSDVTLRTPVHDAAEAGFLDVVQNLIAYGADITIQDFKGNTPAHLASKEGHFKIVQFLAQGMSLMLQNIEGQTVFDTDAMKKLSENSHVHKKWIVTYLENPKTLKALTVMKIRNFLGTQGLERFVREPEQDLGSVSLLKKLVTLQL